MTPRFRFSCHRFAALCILWLGMMLLITGWIKPISAQETPVESGSLLLEYYEAGERTDTPDILRDSLQAEQTAEFDAFKDRIRELLAHHYSGGGYLAAGIDSIRPPGEEQSAWRIYARPGCRFEIGSLDVRLTDNESDLLEDFVAFYGEGDPYEASALESEFRRLVSHFESLGYPLVRVEPAGFSTDNSSCKVSLDVEVTTGEKFRTDGVWVSGLEQYRPEYIETATGIRTGKTVTPELFRRGRRNLENTGFFYEVSEGDLLIRDGRTYVHYEVTERRANRFDLMFGYVPDQTHGYDLIGRGNIVVRNVGWPGTTMDLRFERLETLVSRLEAGFERNWIMGLPVGGGMEFRFFQQDTSYQQRGIQLDGIYNWTPQRRLSLHLIQENTSANQDPGLAVTVLDGVTRSAGFGYQYDNTDNRISPASGMIFDLTVISGFRRITDARAEEMQSRGTMLQQRAKLTIQRFHSPLARQVLAYRISGSTVESPEYTEADLLPIGGSRSIRGYREEQFRVARNAWTDMEYRYLLDPYSHAFLFAAGGVYQRPSLLGEERPQHTEWLYSGGFGFRYRTPIGLMQFTYAVSADDPLHNGKVHFSLSSDF